MKLTIDFANKVYDILVQFGAREDEREDFIYHHTSDDCWEWRFCGVFGFGGKYKSQWNGVSMYSEDETPERLEKQKECNELLKKLKK